MGTIFIIFIGAIIYGIIGALTAVVWNILWNKNGFKIKNDDDVEAIIGLLWVFWPISLMILFIYYLPYTFIFRKIIK